MRMEKQILLKIEEINRLLCIASQCDFKINLSERSREKIFRADSALGVVNLCFENPLILAYDGYNEQLEEFIRDNGI